MKGKMRVSMPVMMVAMQVEMLVNQIGPQEQFLVGKDVGGIARSLDPMLFGQERHGHFHIGDQ